MDILPKRKFSHMIKVRPEEIQVVKHNLKIIADKLSDRLKTQLLSEEKRSRKHGLFWLLYDPLNYAILEKAIINIKKHSKENFYPKAVKKLTKNPHWLYQQGVLGEIDVIGYYCGKFLGNPRVSLEWEREISVSKRGRKARNIDLTISERNALVNLEIMGIHRDARRREHFNLRHEVKEAIEEYLESFPKHLYSYHFFLTSADDGSKDFPLSLFTRKDIPDFLKRIGEARKKGPGVYSLERGDKVIATVELIPLNKARERYASSLDIWSGWMKDRERLRDKIIDKAGSQLPPEQINIIIVPNFGGLDDIDFQEAFLGKEIWHLRKEKVLGMTRCSDGAVSIIKSQKYSPIHALIYFTRDYEKSKKVIWNPYYPRSQKVLTLLE